jgi:hypothetical protein
MLWAEKEEGEEGKIWRGVIGQPEGDKSPR